MAIFDIPGRLTHAIARRLLPAIENWQVERLCDSLGTCGKHVRIRMPTVIESPENVHIMDEVSIASFVHMWGNASIHIGERTMIGSHTAITSATHDPSLAVMSTRVLSEPVHIGNDVWIGAHAVILPGVTIGPHAIIAAGAVVRQSVPTYGVAGGVPATLLRTRSVVDETGTVWSK